MRWPGSSASSEARFTQQHIVHPRIDRARSSDGNVSVLVGKQVLLRCVIDDLGNESVSWGKATQKVPHWPEKEHNKTRKVCGLGERRTCPKLPF